MWLVLLLLLWPSPVAFDQDIGEDGWHLRWRSWGPQPVLSSGHSINLFLCLCCDPCVLANHELSGSQDLYQMPKLCGMGLLCVSFWSVMHLWGQFGTIWMQRYSASRGGVGVERCVTKTG